MSFFWPVWIADESSSCNPRLDVLYYRGRFQLATADALYSDGLRYTPAVVVAKALGGFLPRVKQVLVCGVGLGSVVEIIQQKGVDAVFTLVEIDKAVLSLAIAYLQSSRTMQLHAVCEDARTFVLRNRGTYDFIFLDIFDSRMVPNFVTDLDFLRACRDRLAPNGRLALNYIINDETTWAKANEHFSAIFPHHQVIVNDINRIFITSGDSRA